MTTDLRIEYTDGTIAEFTVASSIWTYSSFICFRTVDAPTEIVYVPASQVRTMNQEGAPR